MPNKIMMRLLFKIFVISLLWTLVPVHSNRRRNRLLYITPGTKDETTALLWFSKNTEEYTDCEILRNRDQIDQELYSPGKLKVEVLLKHEMEKQLEFLKDYCLHRNGSETKQDVTAEEESSNEEYNDEESENEEYNDEESENEEYNDEESGNEEYNDEMRWNEKYNPEESGNEEYNDKRRWNEEYNDGESWDEEYNDGESWDEKYNDGESWDEEHNDGESWDEEYNYEIETERVERWLANHFQRLFKKTHLKYESNS